MSRKRNLTDEEDRLWRQVMRGTQPSGNLIKKAANRTDIPGQARSGQVKPGQSRSGSRPVHPGPTHIGHPPPPGKTPSGKIAKTTPPVIHHPGQPHSNPQKTEDLSNLERKEKHRVLRGKVEIDAKIDLHGMRQNEAHNALIDRVSRARLDGKRVLLVVTGKGSSTGGSSDGSEPFWARGGGVLKAQVPQWLNQQPLRSMIFSVQQAHQRHGGGGALYVFLKRLR